MQFFIPFVQYHTQLFKNVFSPTIGHTLAFIGFLQPASGGILSMAETQARWFVELCKGTIKLPSKNAMEDNMKREQVSFLQGLWSFSSFMWGTLDVGLWDVGRTPHDFHRLNSQHHVGF